MARTRTLAQHIASSVQARCNCEKSGNWEWHSKHTERLETLANDFLPSGSGIDSGTTIDLDKSSGDKLVLNTAFHHMNDGGVYDGWTEHTITVTPAFDGFELKISGRDRNAIKEYLGEMFAHTLAEHIAETCDGFYRTDIESVAIGPLGAMG